MPISTPTFVAPISISSRPSLRHSLSLPKSSQSPVRIPLPTFRCRRHILPYASTSPPLTSTPLTLDLSDSTTLKFLFTSEAASKLSIQINELIRSFQVLQKASEEGRKRQKEKSLEYFYENSNEYGKLRISMECNPNLFTTAFQAKVYIKIDDGTIVISSEIMLTKLVENIKTYKTITSQ